jgi:hypothetical protein
MIERRDGVGFTVEALPSLGIGAKPGGQNFDGNVAAESRIPRAIDLTHPARAQGRVNLVWSEFCARWQGHARVIIVL